MSKDVSYTIDDDLTTYLNSFDIPSSETVVEKEKEKIKERPKRNKNSKKIKRLKKEKDILSQEMLVLRVQFDDLKEKVVFLEKESKRHLTTVKSDLREIKTLLKELKGTSLSCHHEPSPTTTSISKQQQQQQQQ